MAEDQRSATRPHEFVDADRELRKVLDDEIARVCPKVVEGKRVPSSISYAIHVTFSDEVGKNVRRYVRALRLIPGARSELLRRAMLFNSMTAEGTAFVKALAAVQKVFEPFHTVQADDPRSDWVPVAAEVARFEPLSVAHVEQLILDIEGLLDYSPGKTILLRLKEAAEEVVDAAYGVCSDGCQALLLFGIKLSGAGDDAEFVPFLESLPHTENVPPDPESMRLGSQTPSTLKNMLRAVESVAAWVAAAGPLAPQLSEGDNHANGHKVADPTVGKEDKPKGTKKSSRKHKFDGVAFEASEAFKKHRDAGGKQSLKDFCADYAEEMLLSITGSTLVKKLSSNRDKWDPNQEYGRPSSANGHT